MRTILRRLCRLEKEVAPAIDYESFRLANEILDRRRRRLEASGEPFEDVPRLVPGPGPYLSHRDSLRSILQERRSRIDRPGNSSPMERSRS